MAKTEIDAGICGFKTTVTSSMKGERCALAIETDCDNIKKMAPEIAEVDPLQEIAYTGEPPKVLAMAAKYSPHPACPVPSGILKAMEVAAGLALPKDASIKVSRD